MKCPHCGSEREHVLIDVSLPLGSVERETFRACYTCKPEARGPELHPRAVALLPENERTAAWKRRRWVVDRRSSYPVAERLIDWFGTTSGIH